MITWLALGDSYTIGEGVPAAGRWPLQLAAMLCDEGAALTEPSILATTGWTTDELAAGIDAAAPAGPFDLVSLSIGVNNQYRGRAVDNYRDEFASLLERAIELAGGYATRVLVVSIPDWGITAFGRRDPRGAARIGAEIDTFNAAAHAQTQRAGARWIDITAISRGMPDQLADDGLHPAAAQYAAWLAAIAPVARAALPPA